MPSAPVLTSIAVSKLFGRFDHLVEIEADEQFVIVVGPNGVGKTKVLELTSAILSWRLHRLRQDRFDEIQLCFSDGATITFSQEQQGELPSMEEPSFNEIRTVSGTAVLPDGERVELSTRASEFERSELLDAVMLRLHDDDDDHHDRRLLVEARRTLMHETDGEDVSARLGALLLRLDIAGTLSPPELEAYVGAGKSHLIETQRLTTMEPRGRAQPDRSPLPTPAVVRCAEGLSREIKRLDAESGRLGQVLDRSFPRRVLAQQDVNTSETEIRAQYERQTQLRDRLERIGILEPEGEMESLGAQRPLDHTEMRVLQTYLEDTEKKLDITISLLERVELLANILNEKFLFKNIEVNREHGLSVHSDEGQLIPLTHLSSGEQHELILLYDLLFNVAAGSLVMIDEPELSLHVSWQRRFVDDMLKVSKVRSFRFVIATHSPQVIDVWLDRTIQLDKGWD